MDRIGRDCRDRTDDIHLHMVYFLSAINPHAHGLELARVGRLPQPCRPGLRAEDHRHPIVKLRAQVVRRTGDDSEAPDPFAGG
jgi:hypothetical protein